jgi:hypothetical protein
MIGISAIAYGEEGGTKSRLVRQMLRSAADNAKAADENGLTEGEEGYIGDIGKVDPERAVVRIVNLLDVEGRGVGKEFFSQVYDDGSTGTSAQAHASLLEKSAGVKGYYISVGGGKKMLEVLNAGFGKDGVIGAGHAPLPLGRNPGFLAEEIKLGVARDCDIKRPIFAVDKAIGKLINADIVDPLFKWGDDGKWHSSFKEGPEPLKYSLRSALIGTKFGEQLEFCTVCWPPEDSKKVFIKGKRWLDAYGKAVAAGPAPDLGSIYGLYFENVSPSS